MSSNKNELDEILEKEFKRAIVSMVNEIKEDRNKFLNGLQESTKKQLNEIKISTQILKWNTSMKQKYLKIPHWKLEMKSLRCQEEVLWEITNGTDQGRTVYVG